MRSTSQRFVSKYAEPFLDSFGQVLMNRQLPKARRWFLFDAFSSREPVPTSLEKRFTATG
jgi:hypothetical protein